MRRKFVSSWCRNSGCLVDSEKANGYFLDRSTHSDIQLVHKTPVLCAVLSPSFSRWPNKLWLVLKKFLHQCKLLLWAVRVSFFSQHLFGFPLVYPPRFSAVSHLVCFIPALFVLLWKCVFRKNMCCFSDPLLPHAFSWKTDFFFFLWKKPKKSATVFSLLWSLYFQQAYFRVLVCALAASLSVCRPEYIHVVSL